MRTPANRLCCYAKARSKVEIGGKQQHILWTIWAVGNQCEKLSGHLPFLLASSRLALQASFSKQERFETRPLAAAEDIFHQVLCSPGEWLGVRSTRPFEWRNPASKPRGAAWPAGMVSTASRALLEQLRGNRRGATSLQPQHVGARGDGQHCPGWDWILRAAVPGFSHNESYCKINK